MQTQKKTKNGGMGGVMNEGELEVGVMGQQVNVEDVVALAPNEIVEEQVWVGEDVIKAFTANVDRIEMDLERTILMIEKQINVVLVTIIPKRDNANEDVELHAHIDGGDILKFTYYYNLLPHLSFQVERMGGVFFCQSCDCNTFLKCGPQTFTSPSFSMWEGGWGIFLGLSL